ncbi:MAG: response regulator [Betaproteobacteria bacterium]|nr:MAG: response regulator [Betaproteobacteria bacterium]
MGTRVIATLDAEQASAQALAEEETSIAGRAPAALPAPVGRKLLVVDDHPVNLAMLRRQLKVLGLEADTATSGAEALEKWRRGRHGLVITDLQMPEVDGYALARAIRAEPHGPGRPTIVAFTANTQREALEHCTAVGMDDYLTKPAELATLRQKLARWLGADAGVRSKAPIDRARLEKLVGGSEGLGELLGELEATVRSDIAALEAALAAGDGAAVRRVAHRVKGSALTIGAAQLAAAAARLEEAPDALATADAVRPLIDELESVAAAARAELRAA